MEGLEFKGTDRFEVVGYLGEGGMGVVYEALDKQRNARVALKTLKATDPDLLLRFKTEFRALQDLEHANLVSLGELVAERGQWFFTMELIHGVDLRSYVRRQTTSDAPKPGTLLSARDMAGMDAAISARGTAVPAFDEARLRDALAQLTDGLAALHAANKVHRDIKPSNILVTSKGRVVVLDFGLVTEIRRDLRYSDHSLVGTTDYMSPEQGAGQPVASASDWYSVGVILYELLTGRLPFEGAPLEVLMEKQVAEPMPPRERNPRVPPDLDRLCVALLSRQPGNRPTPSEIVRALRREPARIELVHDSRSSRSFSRAFVGRDAEVAQLSEAFDVVRGGDAIAVVVEGPSGIGKSTLVRRFIGRMLADTPGAAVLAGRCYERETMAFKAFDGVIDELSQFMTRLPKVEAASIVPRNAAYLAQVFPVLRRVEAIARAQRPKGGLVSHELRNRAFTALRQLLRAVAEQRPLIVFIDDLQWADADSIALLSDVMHFPHPPPLCLLATIRSEGLDVLDRLRLDCTTRRLAIDRLPRPEAVELATRLGRMAGVSDQGVVAQIAREADGHPLFIHELVRHIEATGRTSGRDAVRLDDALWQRIERLDEPARRVLAVLAVAGAPISQDVAARACEMEFTEYSRWAAQLRVGHLARSQGTRGDDRVETYHDRVREAVVNHLDGAALQHYHQRIATALEQAGAAEHDPQRLVDHLDAAGDFDRAADQAIAAARLARDMLAFDRAAGLYHTALRLGRFDGDEARDLRLQYAAALVEAGRGREAADEYLAVAATADRTTALECTKNAAMELLLCGHIELGMSSLRDVLSTVGLELPKTPRRALMSAIARRGVLRVRGLRWNHRDESELSGAELTRLDVYQAVSMALGAVDHIRGADFQSRFTLAALRAGEPSRVIVALAMECGYLATQGGRAAVRARKTLAVAQDIAERRGDSRSLAKCAAAAGALEYLNGHLAKARVILERAERMLLEQQGGSWELHTVRVFYAWTLRHMGEARQMRVLFDLYRREAVRLGNRYADTTLVRTCTEAWLQLDQFDEAVRALAQTSWEPPAGGYHLQHWYELKSQCEIEIYQRTGETTLATVRDGFDALERSLLRRLQIVRMESSWMWGRLAVVDAERGVDADAALARVDSLARWMAGRDVSFGRVWSRLLQAGSAHLRGDDAAAVASLRAAARLADEVPMKLYAAAARRVLGHLIGGTEGERLIDEADAAFALEGVVNPTRYAALICPGFERR